MEMEITEHDDNDQSGIYLVNLAGIRKDITKSKIVRFYLVWVISILFTEVTTIFVVGCVITVEYYYLGDLCPDRAKDRFVMSTSLNSFSPIDRFICDSDKLLNFTSFHMALCYGYIVHEQSISDIFNQICICAGILCMLSLLFTFLFRISHSVYGRTSIIILVLIVTIMILLFDVLQVRLDFLQYYLLYIITLIGVITIWLRLVLLYLW